ncbi:hypothetical protein KFU94_30840 [Chloroflexi bacterium TSY]|nr:hypothetical protein [Chloroflexi bacterium TSY]
MISRKCGLIGTTKRKQKGGSDVNQHLPSQAVCAVCTPSSGSIWCAALRPSPLCGMAQAVSDESRWCVPVFGTVIRARLGTTRARPGVHVALVSGHDALWSDELRCVWVGQMRDEPFYALISGFEPNDVPGVGTFYDFQDRLLQRERQARSQARRPYQRRDERDQAAAHKDKNDLRPHAGIVNRLTALILGLLRRQPSLNYWQVRLVWPPCLGAGAATALLRLLRGPLSRVGLARPGPSPCGWRRRQTAHLGQSLRPEAV